MGVAAENHVDTGDAACELEIDIHAVMRQQHHGIDLVVAAQAVDQLLHFLVADAEFPVRRKPLWMGDRHVGKRLPDHGDAIAADLLDHGRLEDAARRGSKALASLNAASSVRKTFWARNSPLKRSRLLRSAVSP